MRYFFDTEFIEDGTTIDLISIGIVAEDGREFYRQSTEFDHTKANRFVSDFVLPKLIWCDGDVVKEERWDGSHPDCPWRERVQLREEVWEFCDQQIGVPEFWGYYADYDWVALCQLFGRMIDLPGGWPKFCLDIKQRAWALGPEFSHLDRLVPQTDEHHALADARWNKAASDYLDNVMSAGREPA